MGTIAYISIIPIKFDQLFQEPEWPHQVRRVCGGAKGGQGQGRRTPNCTHKVSVYPNMPPPPLIKKKRKEITKSLV